MVGWTVQGGVAFSRNQSESSANQYNPKYFLKSEENTFVIRAAYGYPFSLSLHWYSQAALSFPIFGKQNRVDQYAQSSLYYQIGEKISNELSLYYSRHNQYQTGSSLSDKFDFSNNLQIGETFRYFIENNINFSIGINYYDWLDIGQNPFSTDRNTNSNFKITFGMNYRFF